METVMSRRIRQFHRNTDGAISVLTLLTIWCLVALIGMIWNTAEYAVQRQTLQNSVDSSAYAASMWKARTFNQVTAQNMLIAQDASADIVFRAAQDTDVAIGGTSPTTGELNAELRYLTQVEAGNRQLRSRLPGLVANINTQYQLLSSALELVQSDISSGTLTFPNQQSATVYKNQVRQAVYAANWVQNTYVPQLEALATQAEDATITEAMIEQAKAVIGDPTDRPSGTEFGDLQNFEDQINGAPSNTTELMQTWEGNIFTDEQNLVSAYKSTFDTQYDKLAAFYNTHPTTITMAFSPDGSDTEVEILKRSDQVVPAANVDPPGELDGDNNFNWTDTIRQNHPEFGRNPNVVINPINPNTQEDGDSDIVYPSYTIPGTNPPIIINCDAPDEQGWGHCWLFPLERYLSSRVNEDSAGLLVFMTPIDQLRQQLAQQWAQELGLVLNVPQLPGSIPDTQPDPITKQPTTIRILPNLTATSQTGDKTDADFAYRRASGSYLNAIRQLVNALQQYAGLLNRFTAPYAVPTWYGKLAYERHQVSVDLGTAATTTGTTRGFMVLPTYNLYRSPPWALGGMASSLTDAISWQIYRRNRVLWQFGVEGAFQMISQPVAEIVNEMISRPWPFEKAPPLVAVPPASGISKHDRIYFYSSFSIVDSAHASGFKTLFPTILGSNQPLAAFAQSEIFNWMEYNDSYGGYYTEKFDEVSLNTFGSLLACPRAWRLSTRGGWNWQARLSVADSLSILANPDSTGGSNSFVPAVQEYLGTAGVSTTDEPSISKINLH
jgi:hypothetical protein